MRLWPIDTHLLPASLPYLLSTLIVLCLGVFVYRKNPSSKASIYFSLMMASCAVWQFFYFCMMISLNPNHAFLFARLLHSGVVFIPTFFYGFTLNMISMRYKHRINICFFISLLFLIFLWTTNLFVSGNTHYWWGYSGKAGSGYNLFLVFFFTLFFLSFLHLKNTYNVLIKNDAIAANRVKYIFLAFIISILASVDYLPVYGIEIYPVGFAFMLMFSFVTAYAIVKHQVLDVNIVIRKSAIYSVTLFIISALYTILILVFVNYSRTYLDSSSLWLTIFTAVAISVSFAPLHNFLSSRVSYLLFHSSPAQLAERNTQMMQELQKQDQMKAVATLATGMAHEIKNPLTALKTFTEYLPEKSSDPEFLAKFQRIVKNEVEKIDGIVRQLLSFSKPTPPILNRLEISEPLNETLEFLNNDFLKHNIHVEKNLLASAQVMGDKKQLKQVFLNIFLNAIDAMPTGGTLRVSISHDQTKNSAVISISDTGQGIAKEDLLHLFDPFFTKKPDGTGLGLSIARRIIEEHNGKIEVSSRFGSGTEFRIPFKCV